MIGALSLVDPGGLRGEGKVLSVRRMFGWRSFFSEREEGSVGTREFEMCLLQEMYCFLRILKQEKI